MTIPRIPLQDSDISLDIGGVAGFFGGDVAVAAMATVHIYPGRKWLGWYNTPGSYEIAKRFGQLGRTRFWDGLYPGVNVEPAELLELDGIMGPKYRALQSGTVMDRTGHLAHLFTQECKDIQELVDWEDPKDEWRKTKPVDVTIATLSHVPEKEERPRMNDNHSVTAKGLLALIPIFGSSACAISCAIFRDWICFSMILLGMFANGISCFVIGHGTLFFTHPDPAKGAPPAHGFLDGGEQIVVLKGSEGAVNPVTRGRFYLRYTGEPDYHAIGVSSFLLTVQFIVQLLLVPQGEIFGQVMFLTSLAVSWIYNSYLSSLDKESIQRRILVRKVLCQPTMRKYRLGTRTSMVVFVLLVLATQDQDKASAVEMESLRKLLNDLLPNDTNVWRVWKTSVLAKIEAYFHSGERLIFDHQHDGDALLVDLYKDTRAAVAAYEKYCE